VNLRETATGLISTITIAMVSFLVASLHASFDALVISIIFGILVANLFGDREALEPGVQAALKVFLPLGIGLYGSQLLLRGEGMGWWPAVLAIAAFIFGVTYLVSRGFGTDKDTSLLLSTGMSICGASAIIVIAGISGLKKEDTSIALISVMTLGLSGMLLYSLLPDVLALGVDSFAFLAGTTLPMLGQVKVASASVSEECMALALKYKLLRLGSLAVLAGLLLSLQKGRRLRIPWFMGLFFLLALAVNLLPQGQALRTLLAPVSKFMLSATLAAVGLSVELDVIAEKGSRAIMAAFLSWGIVVLFIYLLINALSM
jgi:uncharacterized integral membrane protein (TIGR00698 family)